MQETIEATDPTGDAAAREAEAEASQVNARSQQRRTPRLRVFLTGLEYFVFHNSAKYQHLANLAAKSEAGASPH